MMKKITLLLILMFGCFSLSCNNPSANANRKVKTDPNAEPPYQKGVQPMPDSEIAVIDTDFGKIKIELYSNVAPKFVARFKELIREGFYNGCTFHRIDPNRGVVQGGDPLSKNGNPDDDGTGTSGKPDVVAEFSDIPYESGIVGAARGQEIDTQNCQFFITTKKQPGFDKKYTVFGRVIEGMNNAVTIGGAPAERTRPNPSIFMKTVTLEARP